MYEYVLFIIVLLNIVFLLYFIDYGKDSMAVVRAYKSSKHTIHGYETTRTAYNVQCIHTGCERSTKTKQTNNQPNTSVTYCGDADICCCFFIFYQPHRLMYLAYMWSSSFFPLPIICCWCALFSGFGFQSCNALIKYSIDEEMGTQYFEAQINYVVEHWSTCCLFIINLYSNYRIFCERCSTTGRTR